MYYSIKYLLIILLEVIQWAIVIEALLSWIVPDKDNKIYTILSSFTEPFVAPLRKLQERLFPKLMVDLSPIFAIFILVFIENTIEHLR